MRDRSVLRQASKYDMQTLTDGRGHDTSGRAGKRAGGQVGRQAKKNVSYRIVQRDQDNRHTCGGWDEMRRERGLARTGWGG